MAWIESHTVLARHRKCLELAFDLNVKVVQVLGHLHALWHTVLEQQEDGDLSRWSDAMIAQAALWEGEATEFVTRLREREWIDGHLVHDWIDYVGPYLIKKYSSGNVDRLKEIWLKHGYKYGKGQGKFAKQKASKKRVESERKVSIPFPSLPNPSEPNLTIPNQPKEEEENIRPPAISEIQTLVDRWNQIPGVKLCKRVEGKLRTKLTSLRSSKPDSWWTSFFTEVQKSKFLTGRTVPTRGRMVFRADLVWATGPENLAKILSGKYDDGEEQCFDPLLENAKEFLQRGEA